MMRREIKLISFGAQMFLGLTAAIGIPDLAWATSLTYDLSGVTTTASPKQPGNDVQVDWSGAVLTHNKGYAANYFDDSISLSGTVKLCVGASGQSCFDDGAFNLVGNKAIFGAGTFSINGSLALVDPFKTTDDNDVRVNAHPYFGNLKLQGQTLGNPIVDTINLGLKQHPDLGYALRLFDEDPTDPNNAHRILTWIMLSGQITGGDIRAESLPTEAVFNGDLFACLRGNSCGSGGNGGEGPPPTDVPEPGAMLLLGSGLAGLKARRARKAA